MVEIVSHSTPRHLVEESAPPLVLASSSLYRRELLGRLRIAFQTLSPNIDETPESGESPPQTALRLAIAKAAAVAHHFPGALVIGSDQVAMLDGEPLGKPGHHARALEQLQRMRGRSVVFYTALCLHDTRDGSSQSEVVPTSVRFRQASDRELDAYLRIEQPYDCAGSAKSEGLGIALIESIEGNDPNALIGLPLIALVTMLRKAGLHLFVEPPEP